MLGSYDVCPSIAVTDMDRAVKFYGDVLGLMKSEESPAGIFYKSGSSGVFVYPSGYAGTNKATTASWDVEDVAATVEQLKAKGVEFLHYDGMPGVSLEGDVHVIGDRRAAWFKDPDGNILALNGRVS